MRKLFPFLFAWFLLAVIPDGFSQSRAEISKAEAELVGNLVKITYDISDHVVNEEFNVWIEVMDDGGNPLTVNTVIGDIGDHIRGGEGKEIFWDPGVDGITYEVGIYIQVFAQFMEPPVIAPPAESITLNRKVNTAGLVLQSLVVPGLGLSRVTGQPHWLRGVAGYVCIASSIALNRSAVSYYNIYKDDLDNSRDGAFYIALDRDNLSEILAYTAAGIWVADVIWNLVAASNLNRTVYSNGKSFSIKPDYDPVSQVPLLGLNYRF